jgi:hypothetical protein
MAKPDVRVRLSAEGVGEVVSALKRVQAEGQRASTSQARGFGGLNRILGSTTNLLGGLGIALGVRQLTRFIGGAIEAADQLNKLSAKVGASTENLSALSLIARTSDADLNQLGAALVRMNKNIGDAQAGVPTAIEYLKDLGLTIDDLAGLDSVEVFELIASRLTAIPNEAKKGRIAIGLFGRAGAMLLPTMRALAEEGLGNVIKRAEELGVLIDHDIAAAAERIKDDVEILKMQGEALGTRFVAGFAPAMSQALQAVSGDLKQTTDAWQEFGTGVGRIVKWIVAIVGTGVDTIGTLLGTMAVSLASMGKTIALALRGDFKGARAEMQTFLRTTEREAKSYAERVSGRFQLALKSPEEIAGTPEGGVSPDLAAESEEEAAALAAKRAQALQTSLDRELMMVRKIAGLKAQAERRELEEGLQDVSQYYADRRALAEEAYAAELNALEQKEALLEDITDPARRLQEEEKIKQEARRVELEHANELAELAFEERETVRGITQERLGLEQKLLEMQGARIEAERLGFDEQIRQADLVLAKQGESAEVREALLARLRTALEAGADFEEAQNAAENVLAELAAQRSAIEDQVRAGLLSQLEGEAQILEIERERIETLRTLAAALEQAARATGDPEKIEAARQFAASINQIEYSIESAGLSFAEFKATAVDAGTSALTEFFDTGIEGAKTFKDALRDMVTSVVGSLKRLAAELLAVYIMQKLTGLFGSGGSQGSDFIGPMPAAGGGLIRGRGSGTSDSIAARLSDYEFVTRSTVVRQPGVLDHLVRLNQLGARALEPRIREFNIPEMRFAEGGLVESGGSAPAGELLNGQLEIGLEDGLVVRSLESPAAQRVTIKTIQRNSRAVRAALGLP